MTCEQIKRLKEGQRIVADKCIIFRSTIADDYNFTYVNEEDSFLHNFYPAEDIAAAVNALKWD